MESIINLTVSQVALSYIFVLFIIVIVKRRGLKRENEIIISSIRMTLQLIIAGHILIYIFDNPSPLITISLIILMESFAIYTVFRKFKGELSNSLKKVIALSMSIGTIFCITYFLFIVLRVSPWYNPQYFIPIAGMVIGNTMTGILLATRSLVTAMTKEKYLVEEALILGATPKVATKSIVNHAFDVAIMPTINSMLGMGIVFLPGMMTGQILSGTSPITAISYQISTMLVILGSVALSVIILLQLGYKTFFNDKGQLNWV